jgi:RNA polymerase sigma-70 factor (ECF subfamily)
MLSCAHSHLFRAIHPAQAGLYGRAIDPASACARRAPADKEAGHDVRVRAPLMASDARPAPALASDELIERCLNGDQAAWETIVRLYWRKVFNVAYKFVGRHDMAEDLTQDVFLKLYKSLDTFDRRANFQTWLISVSRNLCIDHYRSVRKERETISRDVDAADLSPVSTDLPADTRIERADRVVMLRQALDKLAPTLRTAVMLRDIQELTYQEIADKLHLPEGTVKSRINRGRTELARQIQKLREQQDALTKAGAHHEPDHRA